MYRSMSHVEWHIIRILCDENGMLPERVSYSYLVEDIAFFPVQSAITCLQETSEEKMSLITW